MAIVDKVLVGYATPRYQSVLVKRSRISCTAIAAFVGLCLSWTAAAQIVWCPDPRPDPPVVTINSPEVPSDVCIPPAAVGQSREIQFFDDFSWRSFIALVWPAQNDDRGTPDRSRMKPIVTKGNPRVFETYKPLWEVFREDGKEPGEWNRFDDPNPCMAKAGFDDMVLASSSKFSDLLQAGIGVLTGPLIAQNVTYVRYSTGFNSVLFADIKMRHLYLGGHLPDTKPYIRLPDKSITVKSAWIDMDGIEDSKKKQYYTRRAIVRDPAISDPRKSCSKKLVGLVGLHIVQKTASRPQWIWSTFEHVENAPQRYPPPDPLRKFTFNDGSGTPMDLENRYAFPPFPSSPPTPFNVERWRAIDISTRDTNAKYRQKLGAHGLVWQYYQLAMTQWPKTSINPDRPGDPDHTLPGSKTDTTFSNTTMETFFQQNIAFGCMGCHAINTYMKQPTDMVWSVNIHAYRGGGANPLSSNPSIEALKAFIQRNVPSAIENREPRLPSR